MKIFFVKGCGEKGDEEIGVAGRRRNKHIQREKEI